MRQKKADRDMTMDTENRYLTAKGFTLVEIMVVVVIISVMALFAAPEFINFGPNMRVKAAARDLHTNLQKMKVEAIKRNREAVITFTPVLCPASTYPGGSYTIIIDGDSSSYDSPKNTVLCKSGALNSGSEAFKFTPFGLWTDNDDNTVTGDAIFRLENDRNPTRIYQVSVSIAGGIKTDKL